MKNKAEITKEKVVASKEKKEYCSGLLKKAAETILQNERAEYVGSFTTFLFKEKKLLETNKDQFFIVTQINAEKVDEGFADLGLKQLREDLMRYYGRDVPKEVKR